MTITEAKEIKRKVETIENVSKMRELLSKPEASITVNIQNHSEFMGAFYTEVQVDEILQERFLETIEQYEKDLLEELSRYSLAG